MTILSGQFVSRHLDSIPGTMVTVEATANSGFRCSAKEARRYEIPHLFTLFLFSKEFHPAAIREMLQFSLNVSCQLFVSREWQLHERNGRCNRDRRIFSPADRCKFAICPGCSFKRGHMRGTALCNADSRGCTQSFFHATLYVRRALKINSRAKRTLFHSAL